MKNTSIATSWAEISTYCAEYNIDKRPKLWFDVGAR